MINPDTLEAFLYRDGIATFGRVVPGHLPPRQSAVTLTFARSPPPSAPRRSRREPADDDDEAERIVDALRLPAEQPTAAEAETYLEWLLASLGIPSVSQSGFAASSNQRTRRWRTRSAG
jgi:hypothetical protein